MIDLFETDRFDMLVVFWHPSDLCLFHFASKTKFTVNNSLIHVKIGTIYPAFQKYNKMQILYKVSAFFACCICF